MTDYAEGEDIACTRKYPEEYLLKSILESVLEKPTDKTDWRTVV